MGARDVLRPDVAGEPVLGRVRELDRLLLGRERRRHEDRPEDLLAEDPHRRSHVGEDGRLEEVPPLEPWWAPAAGEQAGAVRERRVEEPEDALVVLRADERPELGCLVERIAHPDPPARAATACTRSSYIGSSTSRRDPAVQRWPLSVKIWATTASTARSKSESANTTTGDLPPSSKESRLSVGAAFAMIAEPVADSPVNEIRLTPG